MKPKIRYRIGMLNDFAQSLDPVGYSQKKSWFIPSVKMLILLPFICVYLLAVCLIIAWRNVHKKIDTPSILLFSLTPEQVYRNKSTEDLTEFIKEVRFAPIWNSTNLIVQLREFRFRTLTSPRVYVDLFSYLLFHAMNPKDLFNVVKEVFLNTILFAFLTKPITTNLRMTYAFLWVFPIWKSFRANTEISIVTTNTAWNLLPPVFLLEKENIQKIMVWYSTNSSPIFQNDQDKTPAKWAIDIQSHIDKHLVWDKTEEYFLQKNGIKETESMGSLLFYPRRKAGIKNKELVITYFDVTPYKTGDPFYTFDTCADTLSGVVSVINDLITNDNLKLVFQLKPKRGYNKKHDERYLSLVRELNSKAELKLIAPEHNLYELIGESNLVLGLPFTSPVVVAKEMDVETTYVYLGKDFEKPFAISSRGIPVIRDGIELKRKIQNMHSGFKVG
jgi:polysaccharide biosynthesis PFTS motif protein